MTLGLYTNSNIQELAQLKQMLNTNGFCIPSGAEPYINSVFGVTEGIGGIVSGDENQRALGIQSILSNIMSLLGNLGEAQAAKQDVDKNNKGVKSVEKSINLTEEDITKNLSAIQANIETEQTNLNNANDKIAESQKKLQEKQEELNKILEAIEEKQNLLASKTNPQEQAAIISEIQGLTGQLVEIAAFITGIQNDVQTQSEAVETSFEIIEDLKGDVVEKTQNGEIQITQNYQKAASELQNNVNTNIKGEQNKLISDAEKEAASAASSNIFTGASIAPKLYRASIDQSMASMTRKTGAGINLTQIMDGIGRLSNVSNILTNYNTAIGSSLETIDGIIGSWNSNIEPLIKSIGTLTQDGGVSNIAESLNNATSQDLQALGADSSNENKENFSPLRTYADENNNDSMNLYKTSNKQPGYYFDPNELITPNVKVKQFGI